MGILLNITLWIFSCTKASKEVLSFSVSSAYEFIGVINRGEETHVGFVKKQFTPNIKVFNLKGTLKDSISLVNAEKMIGQITDVWMISADSICVYSNFNGTLLILNNKGIPFFEKSYFHITDTNGGHYDLLPSHPLYPFTANQQADVIYSTWMWSGVSDKSPQERLEDVRHGFLMCKINPFPTSGNDNDYTFGVKFSDIIEFSRTGNAPVFFAPLYRTFTANNQFILASFYSRYLYLLSDSLTVEKTIKIIDEQQPVAHPIPMGKKGSIQDKANESMNMGLNTVFVTNILYNEVSGDYIVLLKHNQSEDIDNVPFVLQYYDKGFKKTKEIVFNNFDYIPRRSFILSGNLFLEKKTTDYEKKYFEIIPL